MEFKRCSGILMPISSLPGGYGIGSMGKPARDFVDFLTRAGQTIWQILPVGPTGYADSPYQSCSAFAGNPYFIDLDLLAADGLLTKKDYANINWGGDAAKVDYGTLYEKRFTVLRKAYHNFMRQRPVPGYDTPYSDDWYRFQFLSSDWLPDYCLYMAIKEDNGMVDWQQWPRALRVREPEALARFRAEHAEEIEFWAFLQYEFDRQWRSLHAYAKSKGIAIMGDIPIYVAADSADAWAGRELFETDAEGKPRRVQGCFISAEEIDRVVGFVKANGAAQYDESVIDKIEQAVAEKEKGGKGAPSGAAPEPVADEGDELLPAAIDVVMETGQASVSMLQRRLKLGYSRAARIVDEMEQRGIVGPFEGSKPRQLLITREKWEEIKMRGGLGAMSSAAMAAQDAAAENPPVEEEIP